MDVPVSVGTEFAGAFDARLVEQTSASWEFWFGLLEMYVEEHQDSQVPITYEVDGHKLGKWVRQQRVLWDSMSDERRERLRVLPNWSLAPRDDAWEVGFRHLQEYVSEHGDTFVPTSYRIGDYKLGLWVNNQRAKWKHLDEERKQRLLALPGWVVNTIDARWEIGFKHLQKYVEEQGTARVPASYKVGEYRLGTWVSQQRSRWDSLDPERKRRLEELPGWTERPHATRWDEAYELLRQYGLENGHTRVPHGHVFKGFQLGYWVADQRDTWDSLSEERRKRLQELPGWVVSALAAKWEDGFQHLDEFVEENGHACPKQNYVAPDGYRLGSWVNTQRQRMRKGLLEPDRQKRLEAMPGWKWMPR